VNARQALHSAARDISRSNGRPPDEETSPAAQLTALLALHTVGVSVTGATLFGRGSSAIADIHLSDGSRLTLDPIGKYGSPAKLTVELAIQVGAQPKLNTRAVVEAMALLHKLAAHHETMDREAFAVDRGTEFLQLARFDERVAELERRQHEVATELQDVHLRLANVDIADAEALAKWQLSGRTGERPEPERPHLEQDRDCLERERDGLVVAVSKVLGRRRASSRSTVAA
jgi:hypothetical protein